MRQKLEVAWTTGKLALRPARCAINTSYKGDEIMNILKPSRFDHTNGNELSHIGGFYVYK
tara:strand:- start:8 stop:187 length:180 start_codon:yes stop_codon:yes gene_type:complete